MEPVRAYILSVTAGAVFCSILMTLVAKDSACAGVMRLLTGLVMALILVRPVLRIELRGLERYWRIFRDDADRLVEEGIASSKDALAQQVMMVTQDRIIQYGAQLGMNLKVEVTVNDAELPMPTRVLIQGNAGPVARQTMIGWIAKNLGIGEEDVIWNGTSGAAIS